MKIIKTKIKDLLIINPDVYVDNRGFFIETYNKKRFNDNQFLNKFVQDNYSRSKKNVLRGLHFQRKNPQSQLVTLMRGKVFDVCVDLRKHSKTFKKWISFELSDVGIRQIYMGPGIAHGFFVLSNFADLHYKVDKYYNPKDESGLIWNDPEINIKWPSKKPLISKKDLSFLEFNKFKEKDLPKIKNINL